ncbi:MAG TPA: hypothetical protein VLM11_23005, partial [Streptosporangiaceae bacterium]|nr:hypothetical protein [Streptosporangiaceae bacterium]
DQRREHRLVRQLSQECHGKGDAYDAEFGHAWASSTFGCPGFRYGSIFGRNDSTAEGLVHHCS